MKSSEAEEEAEPKGKKAKRENNVHLKGQSEAQDAEEEPAGEENQESLVRNPVIHVGHAVNMHYSLMFSILAMLALLFL